MTSAACIDAFAGSGRDIYFITNADNLPQSMELLGEIPLISSRPELGRSGACRRRSGGARARAPRVPVQQPGAHPEERARPVLRPALRRLRHGHQRGGRARRRAGVRGRPERLRRPAGGQLLLRAGRPAAPDPAPPLRGAGPGGARRRRRQLPAAAEHGAHLRRGAEHPDAHGREPDAALRVAGRGDPPGAGLQGDPADGDAGDTPRRWSTCSTCSCGRPGTCRRARRPTRTSSCGWRTTWTRAPGPCGRTETRLHADMGSKSIVVSFMHANENLGVPPGRSAPAGTR